MHHVVSFGHFVKLLGARRLCSVLWLWKDFAKAWPSHQRYFAKQLYAMSRMDLRNKFVPSALWILILLNHICLQLYCWSEVCTYTSFCECQTLNTVFYQVFYICTCTTINVPTELTIGHFCLSVFLLDSVGFQGTDSTVRLHAEQIIRRFNWSKSWSGPHRRFVHLVVELKPDELTVCLPCIRADLLKVLLPGSSEEGHFIIVSAGDNPSSSNVAGERHLGPAPPSLFGGEQSRGGN